MAQLTSQKHFVSKGIKIFKAFWVWATPFELSMQVLLVRLMSFWKRPETCRGNKIRKVTEALAKQVATICWPAKIVEESGLVLVIHSPHLWFGTTLLFVDSVLFHPPNHTGCTLNDADDYGRYSSQVKYIFVFTQFILFWKSPGILSGFGKRLPVPLNLLVLNWQVTV